MRRAALILLAAAALAGCGGGGVEPAATTSPATTAPSSDRAAELLAEWTFMTPTEQTEFCATLADNGLSAVARQLGVLGDEQAIGVLKGLC